MSTRQTRWSEPGACCRVDAPALTKARPEGRGLSMVRSLIHAVAVALLFAASVLFSAPPASALTLKPYKDDLFAYPALLSSDGGELYRVFDYRELRDINQRDQVPEKRVRAEYVSLGVRRVQRDLVLKSETGNVRHYAVGRAEGASVIVLYLHGQGGSRKQGVDDFTFGGNFNRIKNLMARNGGLYLSPDFSDFGETGANEVAALISAYAERAPSAAIFVACGSMGGAICWRLAGHAQIARRLSGLILLGSHWDDDFRSSPAYRRKVPVFIGHGSGDRVFPVARMEEFYRTLRGAGYPVRFVRFESGSHGVPIRMS